MRNKAFIVAILAVTLILTLTACAKTQNNTTSTEENSSVQQTEQQDNSKDPTKDASSATDEESSKMESASSDVEKTPEKETWKKMFEENLFQKYGVIPEYYEDLGDGIYQVYVKIDGNVVPYVTVNSATGDYHG